MVLPDRECCTKLSIWLCCGIFPWFLSVRIIKYAMGTSVARTSKTLEIYKMADAYEMPADTVDGMSPEDVHNAVTRAVNRAREKRRSYIT